MLISIVFFALRSVVLDFVIFFKYQVADKHKLIPLFFKAFQNRRQCFGSMVGVVVEQHYRPRADLRCNPLANTLRRRAVLPVETINIRNKSNIIFFCCFPLQSEAMPRSIHPFRSLSPKNQGFETSLDARFKRFMLLFLLCFMLCSIFDLIFKSANGSRAEWSEQMIEFPLAKSKEKL